MGSRLRVVSVNLGDDLSVVKDFVHKKGATFPVLRVDAKTVDNYKVEGTPTNLVISPNGTIVYAAEEYDEKEILAAVRKAAGHINPAPRSIHRAAVHRRSAAYFAPSDLNPPEDAAGVTKTAAFDAPPFDATVPAGGRIIHERPFPDVPPDHWAAPAVELLRKAGIVIGYP